MDSFEDADLRHWRWIMAKFILVSRDKEDLYVNVDQVRVLRAQSGGGGTTIVFDMEHTMTVDDDPDRIVRLAK